MSALHKADHIIMSTVDIYRHTDEIGRNVKIVTQRAAEIVNISHAMSERESFTIPLTLCFRFDDEGRFNLLKG